MVKLDAEILADGTDTQVINELIRWARTENANEASTATLWFIIGVLMGRLAKA